MPFFLYILTFTGSEKVLENFSWGSWKVLGFFAKRLGTLSVYLLFDQLVIYWVCSAVWCIWWYNVGLSECFCVVWLMKILFLYLHCWGCAESASGFANSLRCSGIVEFYLHDLEMSNYCLVSIMTEESSVIIEYYLELQNLIFLVTNQWDFDDILWRAMDIARGQHLFSSWFFCRFWAIVLRPNSQTLS